MIELRDVSVTFNGKSKVEAVKNVNLKIEKGEIYGIVGFSGAGKSTLVRTINLLQRPTNGQVFIDGVDITELKGEKLRQVRLRIGMIFQHFNLISGKTVYENIEFMLKANGYKKADRKERVMELLRLVSLEDKANFYPANLSGGQKQRVGIARAIANNPEILLCDEATSALDLESTDEILDLLKVINNKYGITIVFITHEMEVAKKLFHKMAVMSSGEVIEKNDVYSIFAHPSHEITKSLINKNLNLQLPEKIQEALQQGELLKVYYRGDKSLEPVISSAAKNFNINISIIHGKIEYIQNKALGILIINLVGEKDELSRAKEYIRENVSELEEVLSKEEVKNVG
ncbi:ATP-binding cassette domain-containing protein [Clostridium sp. 19966]|uniref:methionine ABC transporter ATP-binding protein n=1 Tax=Clostridium sp. 19966 TaxID=2768166 RepID=UPI0028E06FC6|nr:ATP-binding cassette domain-containing protein [Clostridium sp. 19966]MDT8717946.1 ATP-binding cassette domain-containing protein [Clostridium sp. 19966]